LKIKSRESVATESSTRISSDGDAARKQVIPTALLGLVSEVTSVNRR